MTIDEIRMVIDLPSGTISLAIDDKTYAGIEKFRNWMVYPLFKADENGEGEMFQGQIISFGDNVLTALYHAAKVYKRLALRVSE
jgi:hypothetical protein